MKKTKKAMRRMLYTSLITAILLQAMTLPVQAMPVIEKKQVFEEENIQGVVREFEAGSEKEFADTLEEVKLSVKGNKAQLRMKMGEERLEFQPTLHHSRLESNTALFGVDLNPSSDFRLVKCTITENTDSVDLMESNEQMAGSTVVSLAVEDAESRIYCFQFPIEGFDLAQMQGLSENTSEEALFLLEFANTITRPYEEAVKILEDATNAFEQEMIQDGAEMDVSELQSQKMIRGPLISDAPTSPEDFFDGLAELSKEGSVSVPTVLSQNSKESEIPIPLDFRVTHPELNTMEYFDLVAKTSEMEKAEALVVQMAGVWDYKVGKYENSENKRSAQGYWIFQICDRFFNYQNLKTVNYIFLYEASVALDPPMITNCISSVTSKIYIRENYILEYIPADHYPNQESPELRVSSYYGSLPFEAEASVYVESPEFLMEEKKAVEGKNETEAFKAIQELAEKYGYFELYSINKKNSQLVGGRTTIIALLAKAVEKIVPGGKWIGFVLSFIEGSTRKAAPTEGGEWDTKDFGVLPCARLEVSADHLKKEGDFILIKGIVQGHMQKARWGYKVENLKFYPSSPIPNTQ